VCCFIVKNEEDVIVSMGVLKLNVINNSISPKKKKKHQKLNKKYEVDLEVIVVN
jgi:hypothetical protein